jgi:hypothetical protein
MTFFVNVHTIFVTLSFKPGGLGAFGSLPEHITSRQLSKDTDVIIAASRAGMNGR